jgi:hypothetical protein
LRFFFDNCLSPKLARAIAIIADTEIKHLREKFDADTADEVWIPALAQEGNWIVVTADTSITRGRTQRQVWQQSRLIGFYLAGSFPMLDVWEQAWRLVKWWPVILKQASLAAPGSTYLLALEPRGKIKTL